MGYKTLFEQIKTVCAWNSLSLLLYKLWSTAITGTINLLHILQYESMNNGADSCLIFIAGNLHEFCY